MLYAITYVALSALGVLFVLAAFALVLWMAM